MVNKLVDVNKIAQKFFTQKSQADLHSKQVKQALWKWEKQNPYQYKLILIYIKYR